MPYASVDDLPEEVLDKYKKPSQRRAFMAAFNSTMSDCEGEDCEEQAFRNAHTAAQGVKKTLRDQPKMASFMLRKSRPLIAARNFLRRQFPDGDWTADDKLHLTLVTLLDEAEHAKLPSLKNQSPLDLTITGLSLWQTPIDDFAVVFDVEPSPTLEALQKSLYEHYQGHEISTYSDPENWIPHITLGYMPSAPDPMPDMDFDPFQIEASTIELVQKTKTISRRKLRRPKTSSLDVKIWQDEYGNLQDGFSAYDQLEVSYDPLGADDVAGCANCRYFIGNRCMLVNGLIAPNGWCDLWQGLDDTSTPEPELETGMMSKVLYALGVRGIKKVFDQPSGFKVIDRGRRWIGWYTNAYKDRDGEGFPAAAIQRDINRMWGSGEFPELWFYHVPGTKHGQADWVGLIGRFVVATGTFDDTELAKAFVKSYSDETMSHGFVYNPDRKVDGWYWDFATFEISPTPVGAEANSLTRFEVKHMALDEKQIAELRSRLGPLADTLIEAGKTATAQADATGIAFKASESDKQDEEDDEEEDEDMKAELEAIKASIGQLTNVVTQLALRPEPTAPVQQEAPKSRLTDEMKAQIMAHYEAVAAAEEADKSFHEMSLGDQVVTMLQKGG